MPQRFQTVGLMTRYISQEVLETIHDLEKVLLQHGVDIVLEKRTADFLAEKGLPVSAKKEFGHDCDLIIAIGGDGSFLSAGHCAVQYDKPILGINRGRLGFLADIQPNQLEEKISAILKGNFSEEKRCLLDASIDGKPDFNDQAINDIVLKQGTIRHMLEFEIFINDEFVCLEHADGLIVSTPTGSTAYALSGGGPILQPHLDAFVLLPMFSHTLSSRPLVVRGDSHLRIKITENNPDSPTLRFDGQGDNTIEPGKCFHINKAKQSLRLVHPKDYNYYQSLRSKLGWGKQQTKDN